MPGIGATKVFEGLTAKQFKFAESYLSNGHNIHAAARACGLKHVCNGSRMLKLPKVTAYINNRLQKTKEAYMDFDYKIEKLKKVIDDFIPESTEELVPKKVSVGLQAVAEANKMQGDYAAEKRINVNANMELDPLVKATQDLLENLIVKNKREY
jgi:phage terminase small subunit